MNLPALRQQHRPEAKGVLILNKGLLNVDDALIFGASVKESDSPIGMFGTGLKYAIAVILRYDQEITIYSGTQKHHFTKQKHSIRGKEFDVVYRNGEKLDFTTELGKNWELWAAYRELYCNALDEEDGQAEEYLGEGGEPYISDNITGILVRGKEFLDIHNRRNEYFLFDRTPLTYCPEMVEIYWGKIKKLYFRGVQVSSNFGSCCYTYNILANIELTEDNTIHLSRRVFNMGAKMVVGTLLEEYWHLKHGYDDESREFQNFLIDLIVTQQERIRGRRI